MKRRWIALILISIGIVVAVLTYYGKISFDIGLIISLFFSIILPILTATLPIVIENIIKDRVNLKIENIRFKQNNCEGANGYQIEASLTNRGTKICNNLEATFKITDKNGNSPNLLYVSIVDENNNKTASSKELPMRDIRYAWILENGQVEQGVLDRLRKDDIVGLIFPYETFGAGSAGNGHSRFYSSEHWLRIEPAMKYKVTITVKGQDAEDCTCSKTEETTLEI